MLSLSEKNPGIQFRSDGVLEEGGCYGDGEVWMKNGT